jgi:CBS domain containing-hemolysin-like protein
MGVTITVIAILCSITLSLVFSTLTYSLRGFSRAKLSDAFAASGNQRWLEPTLERSGDLIFVTATARLVANLVIFIGIQHALRAVGWSEAVEDIAALAITCILTLFCSVAIPHAIADHAAERVVAFSAGALHRYYHLVSPVTRLMHGIDHLVRRMAGNAAEAQPEKIEEELEQEILSAVDEGAAEGVVDEQERAIIKSAITFADTTVAQAMTARTDIIGVPLDEPMDRLAAALQESGHSRLPVYDGTLDKIVGILFARDLLRFLGQPQPAFSLKQVMRPALFVPETKVLSDLLADFREMKVHIAVVLDEYGGTAGLVTIEDLLEQLVGEISDEHKGREPEMIRRLDGHGFEIDARIYLDQLNRTLDLNLPEDAGYDTLGGFVSTTLGKIPQKGTSFDFGNARYTVLDAAPQKVNRVRVDLLPSHAEIAQPIRQ